MILSNPGNNLFLPRDIGIDIWWDPINIDGAYGYPADGTGVSSIIDGGKSPNNLTQASGGAQPIYKRSIINGNPVFRFAGAQFMSSPNGVNNAYTGAMTHFIVFSTTNSTPPSGAARIISKPSSWAPTYLSTEYTFSLFGVTYTTGAAAVANDTFYNFCSVYNGSSATDFYRNGTFLVTSSFASVMAVNANNLYFGSRDGAQHFISGDVAFVGVFYRALAAWEISLMNFYLNVRFNLS
jgi:hypothetical protein